MYPGPLQVTLSFGLEQGQDAEGRKKYRRIGDHTASGVNQAAHRLQKAPMVMVDYVGVLRRALAGTVEHMSIATEEMKGAYIIGRFHSRLRMRASPSPQSLTS